MDIKKELNSPKNIVITTHQSPDGDAIGSSMALYHYLIKKGHTVTVIVPDDFPPFLKWLDEDDLVLVYDLQEQLSEKVIISADLIFTLDFNDLKRVGKMADILEKSRKPMAMIDHHLHPKDYAVYMKSDTASCSTAQLIYEFIAELGDEELIDKKIGEGIYCGIMTDSGSFRFPSVSHETHLIAANLIRKGVDHAAIHQKVYDVNSLNRLHLLGYALNEKLEVLQNLPVAVIALSKEEIERFKPKKGDTEGLVNYALSIEGIKMAAFIREDDDKVKISFRSKGDVPVNEFSNSYFNGGGHQNAAGGAYFGGLDEALVLFKEKIVEFINKHA